MAYDIFAYGKMIADTVRMGAYADALRKVVDPHKVVLDIGTGTGILALLACSLGAEKVYAIEPGEAIHLAREIAVANGWSDRIVFYQKPSTAVTIPEPVDIMVSDLRGVLPLAGTHIPSIIDARKRLLSATGTMIPLRDRLYVSIVSAPNLIRTYRLPWKDAPYGIQMRPALDCLAHLWRKARFQEQDLLAPPALWTTLDYRTIDGPDVDGSVEIEVADDQPAHGFAVWFETDLLDDIGFSTAPGGTDTVYGQAFFPWPETVPLTPGDTVTISLRAVSAGNDYIWWWDTAIYRNNRRQAEFRQSTFFAKPMGLENLHRRQASFKPKLGVAGQIDLFILKQIDGQNTIEDIARLVRQRFPDRISSAAEALRRVANFSVLYSRMGRESK